MERLIGIDFGTSTSVIRTKLYDDCDKPVGQELFAQPVVFNNGSSMVPTIVRRLDDSYSFGYEAEIPVKHSEVFRSFKIDLQSEDEEKRELAKLLTRKYFEFLYSDYEHQLVCGLLGDINADNVTTVSYPVKWETETRDFMIQAAKDADIECKLARVHSSDVFYTKESWQDIHARTKCDCVEMEAFALFHNANVLGKNAACLLTISDSFVNKRELTSDERQNSFKNMMTVALEAAIRLYQK